jgi:hypothetical protein
VHHLLQPLVRWEGRRRAAARAREGLVPLEVPLPAPVTKVAGGVLLVPEDRPRAELASSLIAVLRHGGLRVAPADEWDDYDARVTASNLVDGRLVSSAHPPGTVQVRVNRKLRWRRVALAIILVLLLAWMGEWAIAGVCAAIAAGDVAWGWWRTGPRARRAISSGVAG